MADTLMFLQLTSADGKPLVKGESTRAGFDKQIEIESFSWSLKAEHAPLQGSDKVSTQVEYGQLTVTKFFDKSSTGLCQLMAGTSDKGGVSKPTPFDIAVLTVVDMVVGEQSNGVPVLQIELQDGLIEDIKLAVAESGKSMQAKETVALSYRRIKLTYFQASGDRASRGRGLQFDGEAASLTS